MISTVLFLKYLVNWKAYDEALALSSAALYYSLNERSSSDIFNTI